MRVLVTGSSGFIGNAVLNEFRANNWESVLFDHKDGSDIRNRGLVNDYVSGVDAVVHLAGTLGTAELFDTPAEAVRINVEGSTNVIAACAAHEVPYIGITMPPVFPSLYTATKRAAVNIAEIYNYNFGLRYCHVRAYNVFGEGQAVGFPHPRKIIPSFAVQAWRGEPISIWGDGTQSVDLIYVYDLANIFYDALDSLDDDELWNGCEVEGGTGVKITVNEVADWVNERAGNAAGVEYLPMRLGEEPQTDLVATHEYWPFKASPPALHDQDLNEVIDWYEDIARDPGVRL